ncbi:MAG: glucokinase [Asticcacaulis sp.]|nr:glucokinase [Asticcacaulis sp.]
MADPVLLCDLSLAPTLGLALAGPGERPRAARRVECETRAAFDAAILDYLDAQGSPNLAGVGIAARGWEDQEGLHPIGLGFSLTRDDVRSLLGVKRVNFVNNFVARALAVPRLRRDERIEILAGNGDDEHAIAVLGPHFGLGLASMISDGMGGWVALHGEGGHSDMPARGAHEWHVIEAVRARTGYVSRETVMSVAGVTAVWQAVHVVAGEAEPEALAPEAIVAAARSGNVRAKETIGLMTVWLAGMASDIALIVGATSGVYLTGALLDILGDQFDFDVFRARFLDKGPRSAYVASIPVYRTTADDLELRGLATLFE